MNKNLKENNIIKNIKQERLNRLNNYLEQIPEEKQEGILIGLEMVVALYKPNDRNTPTS